VNAVRTMRDRIPDLVVICNGVLILSRDRITTVVILSWTMRDRITDFVVIW